MRSCFSLSFRVAAVRGLTSYVAARSQRVTRNGDLRREEKAVIDIGNDPTYDHWTFSPKIGHALE